MLTNLLLESASRGSEGHRALILTYHRVLDVADPLQPDCPSADQFERQVAWMARHANVLTVRQLAGAMRSGGIPPRCICITFDDGYRDNFDVAAPILLKYQLRATFFVATGYLDGGTMWNDKVIDAARLARTEGQFGELLKLCGVDCEQPIKSASAGVSMLLSSLKYRDPCDRDRLADALWKYVGGRSSDRKMMTPDEVAGLSERGMEVGAHTVSHPILANLDDDGSRREISESKATLERIVGNPVTSFAYPNGRPDRDYAPRDVSAVKQAGYDAAVSTEWAAVSAGDDILQLPRVGVWQHRPAAIALHMLRAYRQSRRSSQGAGLNA